MRWRKDGESLLEELNLVDGMLSVLSRKALLPKVGKG